MMPLKRAWMPLALCALPALAGAADTVPATGGRVLVESGTTTRYLANVTDPGTGPAWIKGGFDDRGWAEGRFAIGHDLALDVHDDIVTAVPAQTRSIYTRTTFVIGGGERVRSLFLGTNYDDGYVAWINGHEIARSSSMPGGEPRWDSEPASHEARHRIDPRRLQMRDISAVGIPALREGENLLAIGIWNHSAESTDLMFLPRLVMNQPQGAFVTRGPYLQSGTAESLTVRWRTDRPTDSRVALGLRPGSLDRSYASHESTIDHELRLDGLEPDTTYHYSVGTADGPLEGDGGDEYSFRTAPLPGTRRPFRAWVIGDSGTAGMNVRRMRDGFGRHNGGHPVSLWITLGDNAYDHGTDAEYQEALFDVFPLQLRRWVLWSTGGNHDGLDSPAELRGDYYDIFTFPTAGEAGGVPSGTEAYYSFDFANAHFVSLASDHVDVANDTKMLAWLERDLAATRADWTVVFFHHAPYGNREPDSDTRHRMDAMRTRVLPLLDAGGVDLVLTGHTHAYQRSRLLSGHYGSPGTLTPDMIVDGGDGKIDGDGPYRKPPGKVAHSGIVYAVVGSSSEATAVDLDHPALPFSMTVRGSLILDLDGDRLDAQFVDWKANVRDHFAIVKPGPPASPSAPPSR